MKIIYNPSDGAPITSFVFDGIQLDPHFPDGYEFRNSSGLPEVSNGLIQYPDATAEELKETYQFLVELTPEKAKEIIERPANPEYKCDFPGCDFATTHKVALSGHKRSHANQDPLLAEAVVDPAIPVAGGRQTKARQVPKSPNQLSEEELATQNGIDKDGVEWYGEGVKVESPTGFSQAKPVGKGHFAG